MATAVATEEAVFEAASALLAEGINPTTINVVNRIGGSNNTVGRHLATWRNNQVELNEAPPDAVDARARELAKGVWRIAQQVAAEEIQRLQVQHATQIDALDRELTDSRAVVHQLESTASRIAADMQRLNDENADYRVRIAETVRLQTALIASNVKAEGDRSRVESLERESAVLRAQVASLESQAKKLFSRIGVAPRRKREG